MKSSKIAVCLVTHNGMQYLPKCFHALRQQTLKDFDVCVLDNVSDDGTILFLKAKQDMISRVSYSRTNRGFTGGFNRLFSKVRHRYQYVVLLNQDTVPHANWLENLIAAAESTQLAIIGSNVRSFDDRSNQAYVCRPVWFVPEWGALVYGDFVSEITSCNFVAGTACLLRTESLRNVDRLFDERFFMYHEDVDLSIRLVAKGKAIGVAPKALIWHDNAVRPWVAYYVIRNLHWVLLKNFGLRFYLCFLSRTIRWTLLATRNITGWRHNYAIRGNLAGISGALRLALSLKREDLNLSYLCSIPQATYRKIMYDLKEGQNVIFHA